MLLTQAAIHPSWRLLLAQALATVDKKYLHHLTQTTDWLPGKQNIFNAFSQPLSEARYILFGESPYPRLQSANGYAFWDAAVTDLWSSAGLAKPVNRATSLRNLLKMLLLAAGDLNLADTSQAAIAAIDKTAKIQTISELFNNLIKQGFVLLNASLVLSPANVQADAKAWRPFMAKLLALLAAIKPELELILFGNLAKLILALPAAAALPHFVCEHPYNISFITNPNVVDFFRPFNLLAK